jgi:hypothetical protein
MANGTETQEKTAVPAKAGGGRGPSYPALTLEEAIAKAGQFWAAEKRGAAPTAAAARHWGYSETSSSGKTVIAALIQFGLMEDQGAKDARTVKLTARALDILLDVPDSPKRLKAIQEAVRAPKLYADILAKWPAQELPSDQTLRFYLLREKSFNEPMVDGFIRDFRTSVSFAGLDKPVSSGGVGKVDPASLPDEDDLKQTLTPEIGDLVQWEASGVLRLEAPRRVRAKTEHDGSWWVFVEGSETGIPMEETIVLERKAEAPPSLKQPPVLPMSSGAPAVSQPGEVEASRGKLGDGVTYRLMVTGEMGPKQISKLIKLLEAQKSVLDDDDEIA